MDLEQIFCSFIRTLNDYSNSDDSAPDIKTKIVLILGMPSYETSRIELNEINYVTPRMVTTKVTILLEKKTIYKDDEF